MTEAPKIFFGGRGRLGQAFFRNNQDFLTPTHTDVDITDPKKVYEYIRDLKPACVIHAAAIVGRREAEYDMQHTYQVNVVGTGNIARACLDANTRLAYISSVAIFDGNKGRYREKDTPNPSYYYGWTKLLGEQSVAMIPNHTIVRTDFFNPSGFKYNTVFTDHFCSKIPIDELALILRGLVKSEYRGIINIGRERDTLFNILKQYIPDINGITIAESNMPDFPRDLSLDLNLLRTLFPVSQ